MPNSSDRLNQTILDFFENRRWKKWLFIVAIVAAAAYVIYVVRPIWVPLGVAFLIAMMLDPVVDRMEARGWSRTSAAFLIFVIFIATVTAVIWGSIPLVSGQVGQIQERFEQAIPDRSPAGIRKLIRDSDMPQAFEDVLVSMYQGLNRSIDRNIRFFSEHATVFLGNLLWLVIIPIIAFYALRDFHLIFAKGLLLVPKEKRDLVQTLVEEVSGILGKYIRALAFVSFLNGLTTWIVLMLLGVEGAFTLGLIAGIIYSIPYLGAIITVALIAVVAFLQGGMQFMLLAAGANIILHQVIFDNVVVPRILGGHVGLHPIWAIIALLIGNTLMGLLGMILAVPIAATIQLVIVALVPKLGQKVELPTQDESADTVEKISDEIRDAHLEADATEELHKSVSDAVERIEAEVEANRRESLDT